MNMNLVAIKDGIVTNVIAVTQADRYASRQFLEAKGYTVVENADAGIGDTFDGQNFTLPPKPAIKPKLTHRQFLKRLTSKEFKAIRQAAKNNPDVDMFLYLFERAQEIDLADPDTVAGLQMLETAGILNAGRAAEILA
jgi:hypothetical protein